MLNNPIFRAQSQGLLKIGMPLIGSNLAQFAIGFTDTAMLGWYDVTALAGQVLGGGFFFILLVVGSGFAGAVMPLVAQARGSGDVRQIRRVTRMGLWISMLFAAIALVPMMYCKSILLAVGQKPEVVEQASLYLYINSIAIIPALFVMVLRSYLSALEHTAIVLKVTLLAVAVNAAMNYVLIFGKFGAPELGVQGAAIASLGVHIVSAVVMVIYPRRYLSEYALFSRLWRRDGGALREVFRLGWPIGLTNLAEVGLFIASSLMMGWIGEAALAAHGAALQLSASTFLVHMALSQALTIRAGEYCAVGDTTSLRWMSYAGMAMSLLLAFVSMIAFLLFPGPLLGIFIGPDVANREQVLAIGVVLLGAAAIFQLVDAAQVIALGLLRGVQDTRVPMLIAAISYWAVGMSFSYGLGFILNWGGIGIWLGLAAGLALAAVLLSWRFWKILLPALETNATISSPAAS